MTDRSLTDDIGRFLRKSDSERYEQSVAERRAQLAEDPARYKNCDDIEFAERVRKDFGLSDFHVVAPNVKRGQK